jgi:hypothetical protein
MGGGAAGGAQGNTAEQLGAGLTRDQQRQIEAEFQQRLADAQALRAATARMGPEMREQTQQLDQVIANMQSLEQRGLVGDPKGIAELQSKVVEGIKAVEFGIRKQLLNTNADKVFLGNSDEVPTAFQKMVEEYTKALSKSKTTGGGSPPPPQR